MSIKDFLTQYANNVPSRWHTPGHKGNLNSLDLTELVCDSDLEKFIASAENNVASAYGVKKINFLTNGSSIGIKAVILTSVGDILCFKGCHQAIQEGAELAKVKAIEFDTGLTDNGLPIVATAKTIADALKKHPNVKAVYVESPDYYGRVVDKAVIDTIKKAGKFVFVDSAHGAHLAFSDRLKGLCLAPLADATNLSAHKTLDAYTQTAYLAINSESLFASVDTALKNLGTTSPNYMLMASLESAVESAIKYDYEQLYQDCIWFKNQVPCLTNDDFTRLVVDANALGTNGKKLTQKLIQKNIYAEKFTDRYVVFIATPHETRKDFDALANAIKNYDKP